MLQGLFQRVLETLLGFCSVLGRTGDELSRSVSRRKADHAFWSKWNAHQELSRGTFATFPMSAFGEGADIRPERRE